MLTNPSGDLKMNETIIATIAALVSSIMAFISWWYSRELSKAAISMVDVKVWLHCASRMAAYLPVVSRLAKQS
jgi:hypothetical protein